MKSAPASIAGSAIFICIAAGVLSQAAAAESVLWSATKSLKMVPCDGADCSVKRDNLLDDILTQVRYSVRVTEAATGASIPPFGFVSAGTAVRFEFIPYVSEDIHSRGLGGVSFHGDWTPLAAAPSGAMCHPTNHLSQIKTSKNYLRLSVNPPARSVESSFGGCTTAADGASKTCVLSHPGIADAAFVFGQTYAQFWYSPGSGDADGCNTPLRLEYVDSANPYQLGVPAQTIPYPITVISPDR